MEKRKGDEEMAAPLSQQVRKTERKGPRAIILLHDGIPGHLSQSKGVVSRLEEACGALVMVREVPKKEGFPRFVQYKLKGAGLRQKKGKGWGIWTQAAGGGALLLEIMERLVAEKIPYGETLFLSAGSTAAPFTLDMARSLGARCCTLMTPSVLGTAPFDYALVPRHDDPPASPRICATLGAPNMLRREDLAPAARELLERYPSEGSKRWVFLVGGDDRNYSLSPDWVRSCLDPLVDHGIEHGAEIYLTTSRRTSRETEELLAQLLKNRRRVRMYLPASRQTFSPVKGLLGLATRVFCTEDSVSMVSEAVTAGHRVSLLRGYPRNPWVRKLQRATENLWKKGILPGRMLWGAPRFDRLFRALEEQGYLEEETGSFESMRRPDDPRPRVPESFNEAARCASWLLERW